MLLFSLWIHCRTVVIFGASVYLLFILVYIFPLAYEKRLWYVVCWPYCVVSESIALPLYDISKVAAFTDII